jgi:hypothetical protein
MQREHDSWKGCRAARIAAASARTAAASKSGTVLLDAEEKGDSLEFADALDEDDSEVWREEGKDRYSGAGGREMSEEEMKQVMTLWRLY